MVNILWYGHSMWKITDSRTTIITDPFNYLGYALPKGLQADILFVSHDHFDHNNINLLDSYHYLVQEENNYENIPIPVQTFTTWHDDQQGKERGKNLLFKFELDGLHFLHCGDLGHIPDNHILEQLNPIDVLFIPVGGRYTLDAPKAKQLMDILKPTYTFPMHYRTDAINIDISPIEPFLQLVPYYKRVSQNSYDINPLKNSHEEVIVVNYE